MQPTIDRYGSVTGLPEDGRFIPVTYSELSRLTCRRRFWFQQIEQLRSMSTATERGSGWDVLVGDVYRWWIERDQPYRAAYAMTCPWCAEGRQPDGSTCPTCEGTGDGVLARLRDRYEDLRDEFDVTDWDPEYELERLARSLDGYLRWYEGGPLQTYRAIGSQVQLARAVLSPRTGQPYRTEAYLVRTERGLEYAGTGALVADAALRKSGVRPLPRTGAIGAGVYTVTWPVYLLGTLDLLLRHRTTGAGWVADAKYTKAPDSYEASLAVDPQLPGYCWLLQPHLARFGLSSVAGFGYDLTDSRHQNDPEPLKWRPPSMEAMKALAAEREIEIPKGLRKSEDLQALLGITEGHGGFSKARNQGVPSWRFRKAIRKAGLDVADYEDVLNEIEATLDSKLYRRIYAPFTQDDIDRFGAELFARAQVAVEARRLAARAETRSDLDVAFPRTPICAVPGGSCPFTGPCANDSPEARRGYDPGAGPVWPVDPNQTNLWR